MCRIDGAERAEVHSGHQRKARKLHKCSECRRQINVGETYQYDFTVFEGSPDTYKTCQHCCVLREWLLKNCGGYIYTEVADEVREHAEEYRYLAIPLLRVTAGARRKWKRFGSDELMPIPTLPPPITVAETRK